MPIFDGAKFDALKNYLLNCEPTIDWETFEEILNFAIELEISIDGKVKTSKQQLLDSLMNLFVNRPIYFKAYFAEIYEVLSRESLGSKNSHLFKTRKINAANVLDMSRKALENRLALRTPGMSWKNFVFAVRESIDLGINREPKGIGNKMHTRMSTLMKIYLRDAPQFDATLEWIIKQVEIRTADPDTYPRSDVRKERRLEAERTRTRYQSTFSTRNRFKYSNAGSPWDTAEHWGWYY